MKPLQSFVTFLIPSSPSRAALPTSYQTTPKSIFASSKENAWPVKRPKVTRKIAPKARLLTGLRIVTSMVSCLPVDDTYLRSTRCTYFLTGISFLYSYMPDNEVPWKAVVLYNSITSFHCILLMNSVYPVNFTQISRHCHIPVTFGFWLTFFSLRVWGLQYTL